MVDPNCSFFQNCNSNNRLLLRYDYNFTSAIVVTLNLFFFIFYYFCTLIHWAIKKKDQRTDTKIKAKHIKSDNFTRSKVISHFGCTNIICQWLYIRHGWILPFKKKNPIRSFLVAQNCIKKDIEIYIFLLQKVFTILSTSF